MPTPVQYICTTCIVFIEYNYATHMCIKHILHVVTFTCQTCETGCVCTQNGSRSPFRLFATGPTCALHGVYRDYSLCLFVVNRRGQTTKLTRLVTLASRVPFPLRSLLPRCNKHCRHRFLCQLLGPAWRSMDKQPQTTGAAAHVGKLMYMCSIVAGQGIYCLDSVTRAETQWLSTQSFAVSQNVGRCHQLNPFVGKPMRHSEDPN